jgi:hypothetical protein
MADIPFVSIESSDESDFEKAYSPQRREGRQED